MLDVFLKREGRAQAIDLEPTNAPRQSTLQVSYLMKRVLVLEVLAPLLKAMSFLELAIPKSQAAWNDYYGTNYQGRQAIKETA